jgi:pilus assembly protein CpaF
MNTGHEGGCGTLHANSAADVPARMEALAMAAGMPQAALHSQLASAVDAVVHLARRGDGSRHVSEIAVLRRGEHGLVVAEPAVTFPGDGSTREHPGAERLGERLRR